jgi:hypothetical protein
MTLSQIVTKTRKSIKKVSFHRLTFIFYWSGREDLNLRPSEPHSDTLPDCATPRLDIEFRVGRFLPPSHNPVKDYDVK